MQQVKHNTTVLQAATGRYLQSELLGLESKLLRFHALLLLGSQQGLAFDDLLIPFLVDALLSLELGFALRHNKKQQRK